MSKGKISSFASRTQFVQVLGALCTEAEVRDIMGAVEDSGSYEDSRFAVTFIGGIFTLKEKQEQ